MTEQELMLHQIDVFEAQTGKKLEVKDGKPYSKVSIDCNSDYLPDNLVVDSHLFCRTKSTKLPKGLKVIGELSISGSKITEIPDDCEFGSLDMSYNKKIIKLKDNISLNYLNANGSSLTKLPKGLKVKGEVHISNTKITEIPDDCEFDELYMGDTKITKLRDNLELKGLYVCYSSLIELPKGLKVKGSLNISHTNITEIPDDCEFECLSMGATKITKLRDNLILDYLNAKSSSLQELPKGLVIYGCLDIKNTVIKSLPYDCLVGRVYCNFKQHDERYDIGPYDKNRIKKDIVHISHPSGREFLHVDGILSEVIEKKGNVYHVRNGVNDPITYVVTDGNNHWAHGETLEEAKQDLIYKISKRDKSEYESLTLDSELTYNEAVVCYRVITGACRAGTQDYLEKRLPEPKKEKYSIKEMIELTKNEYGGRTLQEFFDKS